MSKCFLVFITTVIVVGCAINPVAQRQLVKAGATQEDFRRDMLTCRQYGMQSAQTNGLSGNMFVDIHIEARANECMSDLGWH
jgi:hypothetical protein